MKPNERILNLRTEDGASDEHAIKPFEELVGEFIGTVRFHFGLEKWKVGPFRIDLGPFT